MTSRTERTVKKGGGNNLVHSDATKAKALQAFRIAGTVMHACTAAGIGRRTWYDWMESDPAFASAVMDANEAVSDDLEEEAVKRAKDGSDTLLIFLLKSRRRSQYGDRLQITTASPEVQTRLQATVNLVSSKAPEILKELEKIWQ